MMWQLTDAFFTGKPPAFWSAVRGRDATEPPIGRFHEALAQHERKLDALMAAIEKPGGSAGGLQHASVHLSVARDMLSSIQMQAHKSCVSLL